MYFVNDNFLDKKINGIKEGGIVRNIAWIDFLKAYFPNTKFIDMKITHKIFKHIHYVWLFVISFFIYKDTFFFLYPRVGMPVLNKGIRGKIYRKTFLIILENLCKRKNSVIIDISDIKYEQAIDLELSSLDMQEIKRFEEALFSMDLKFIFASYSMREYAVKKHNIKRNKTCVCINGGFICDDCKDTNFNFFNEQDKIKYVYAGTLNKGRMIEEMINAFPDDDKYCLILLGSSGEWINDYIIKSKRSNIKYLGAFEEKAARTIVSMCDIGLIPYDDNRLYYNIAYPTKLSFYITAGIPFLSTPVSEVKRVLSEYDIGFGKKISDWRDFVISMTKEDLLKKKQKISNFKHKFTWNEIFSNCDFLRDGNV